MILTKVRKGNHKWYQSNRTQQQKNNPSPYTFIPIPWETKAPPCRSVPIVPRPAKTGQVTLPSSLSHLQKLRLRVWQKFRKAIIPWCKGQKIITNYCGTSRYPGSSLTSDISPWIKSHGKVKSVWHLSWLSGITKKSFSDSKKIWKGNQNTRRQATKTKKVEIKQRPVSSFNEQSPNDPWKSAFMYIRWRTMIRSTQVQKNEISRMRQVLLSKNVKCSKTIHLSAAWFHWSKQGIAVLACPNKHLTKYTSLKNISKATFTKRPFTKHPFPSFRRLLPRMTRSAWRALEVLSLRP